MSPAMCALCSFSLGVVEAVHEKMVTKMERPLIPKSVRGGDLFREALKTFRTAI